MSTDHLYKEMQINSLFGEAHPNGGKDITDSELGHVEDAAEQQLKIMKTISKGPALSAVASLADELDDHGFLDIADRLDSALTISSNKFEDLESLKKEARTDFNKLVLERYFKVAETYQGIVLGMLPFVEAFVSTVSTEINKAIDNVLGSPKLSDEQKRKAVSCLDQIMYDVSNAGQNISRASKRVDFLDRKNNSSQELRNALKGYNKKMIADINDLVKKRECVGYNGELQSIIDAKNNVLSFGQSLIKAYAGTADINEPTRDLEGVVTNQDQDQDQDQDGQKGSGKGKGRRGRRSKADPRVKRYQEYVNDKGIKIGVDGLLGKFTARSLINLYKKLSNPKGVDAAVKQILDKDREGWTKAVNSKNYPEVLKTIVAIVNALDGSSEKNQRDSDGRPVGEPTGDFVIRYNGVGPLPFDIYGATTGFETMMNYANPAQYIKKFGDIKFYYKAKREIETFKAVLRIDGFGDIDEKKLMNDINSKNSPLTKAVIEGFANSKFRDRVNPDYIAQKFTGIKNIILKWLSLHEDPEFQAKLKSGLRAGQVHIFQMIRTLDDGPYFGNNQNLKALIESGKAYLENPDSAQPTNQQKMLIDWLHKKQLTDSNGYLNEKNINKIRGNSNAITAQAAEIRKNTVASIQTGLKKKANLGPISLLLNGVKEGKVKLSSSDARIIDDFSRALGFSSYMQLGSLIDSAIGNVKLDQIASQEHLESLITGGKRISAAANELALKKTASDSILLDLISGFNDLPDVEKGMVKGDLQAIKSMVMEDIRDGTNNMRSSFFGRLGAKLKSGALTQEQYNRLLTVYKNVFDATDDAARAASGAFNAMKYKNQIERIVVDEMIEGNKNSMARRQLINSIKQDHGEDAYNEVIKSLKEGHKSKDLKQIAVSKAGKYIGPLRNTPFEKILSKFQGKGLMSKAFAIVSMFPAVLGVLWKLVSYPLKHPVIAAAVGLTGYLSYKFLHNNGIDSSKPARESHEESILDNLSNEADNIYKGITETKVTDDNNPANILDNKLDKIFNDKK